MAKPKKAKKKAKAQVSVTGYLLPDGDNLRATKIDKALAEWCRLQEKEDAAIIEHVKPYRDAKNAIKAKMKADFGIPTKAFNARAALRQVELGDDEEVTLAVNEMFSATPVGKGVDLVVLAETLTKKREKEAEAKTKATVQEESL